MNNKNILFEPNARENRQRDENKSRRVSDDLIFLALTDYVVKEDCGIVSNLNTREQSAVAAFWRRGSGLSDQLAQHVRQDAAVLVVIDLDRRIDAQLHRNLFSGPVRAAYDQPDVLLRSDPAVESDDVESFRAVEVERLRADAFFKLQRQHAHSDQVAAVNPLEALGDDRTHAQQPRPFRRPIARAASAVLLACDHD